MDYVEITVKLVPKKHFADLLMDAMGEVGFESFVETEDGFKAYIPENEYVEELETTSWAWSLEGVKISSKKKIIARTNWNEEWEKNFDPILVDEKVYIFAPFHPAKPEMPHQILIEPKMSFGTGHHETTHLMVQFILEQNLTGKSVLDMGTGTGILAILASQKGAKNIVAIDIDDWSVENTIENAERNKTPMETRLGGKDTLKAETFDVIFANINLNILLDDMPAYVAVLAAGGTILFSGFYERDLPQLTAHAEKLHLTFVAKKQRKNWMAAEFVKA